ncbi:amidohydrolase family protein [Candidatus Merdisoma sp. HCP28S3_D10]|uniref:amidohydrolase family protein n=1 Tax=unclassified Candidatus Merdisoma TaxID=3099611 RepID=UPI003F8AF9A5
MFGECHAHVIMDGKNYKAAVALHKNGPDEQAIREHLAAWQQSDITFVRDGGDAYGVSERARELAGAYGIDYRTPIFAIHKRGHYGGIVGLPFDDRKGYRDLVDRARKRGADFIKIMISGIMEFDTYGKLTEEGLEPELISYMIETAHDAGMKVMAHGNGDRTVQAALAAGVDTLEHGNYMEEETLCQLAESPTIWVPTFAPTGNLTGCGRFPDEQVKAILERQSRAVRFAFEKGARIGLGSDSGAYLVPHGQGLLDEYAYMKAAVGRENVGVLDRRLAESEKWIRKEMKKR